MCQYCFCFSKPSVWSTAPDGEKVKPGHSKSRACHAKSSSLTCRSDAPKCTIRYPSRNELPDLLTSLMNVSLVLLLLREVHLCRSSSNVPRLPLFETTTNPSLLILFWQHAKSFAPATLARLSIFYTLDFEICFTPPPMPATRTHISYLHNVRLCSDSYKHRGDASRRDKEAPSRKQGSACRPLA